MAPAAEHQALIVVATVGLPDAVAAQPPLEQGETCIQNEGSKHDWREPRRPQSVSPTERTKRRREKSQRNGTCVAHENARGRKVEQEKPESGARDTEACNGIHCVAGQRGCGCVG